MKKGERERENPENPLAYASKCLQQLGLQELVLEPGMKNSVQVTHLGSSLLESALAGSWSQESNPGTLI